MKIFDLKLFYIMCVSVSVRVRVCVRMRVRVCVCVCLTQVSLLVTISYLIKYVSMVAAIETSEPISFDLIKSPHLFLKDRLEYKTTLWPQRVRGRDFQRHLLHKKSLKLSSKCIACILSLLRTESFLLAYIWTNMCKVIKLMMMTRAA